MWREVFKPLYKAYCDLIHKAGKFAFFHSDGHIAAIYDDLIEQGRILRKEQGGLQILLDLEKQDKAKAIAAIEDFLSELKD